MKNKVLIVLLIALFGVNQFALSQDKEKPKVALVLSGGGAKGIAHIPLLEALDSLGIVPDVVIGTSMGSIVGGLYSIGYSGDTISHIASQADWGELLGGDISLEDVSMEEKSEFKRHLVDFDLIEGKPKVNAGILKDQKLREFISSLSYPVFEIDDFDNLPIPFRAMTTDIVNGKEVLLSTGRIGFAMRASMSIPGVFEPMEYENTLLVDGGVVNNFPVDVAKQLGADIIIGSDVGGGMQSKEDLESIPALIFQAGMLTSNLKNPKHREMCDILIDHMPNLTYSTGDFDKSDEIYIEGKVAVQQNLDALVKLAEQVNKFKQRVHELPDTKDEFVVDSLIYTDISEANLDLVKARADIKPNKTYSSGELINGIDKAMGTNLFRQITYNGYLKDSLVMLELKGYEHSRHQLKGSLHYDSYRSVGILANYTGRNVLGKASRILVTIDIAVQPRFKIQYQKTFGEKKNWWWRSELLGEFLKQKFFLGGEIADNFNSRYGQFDNQVNMNLNSKNSYVGLDLSYEYSNVVPEVDPDINDNVLNLREYTFKNLEFGGHYMYSKFNRVYYPSKGTFVRGFISRSLLHDVDLTYSTEELGEVKGSTNAFTKFGADVEHRMSFSPKTTGIIGANFAFTATDKVKDGELSFIDYGYSAKYSLGGIITAPRRGTYTFPGMHEDEIFFTQIMNLQLGVQFNPTSKLFITPHLNFASVGFDDLSNYFEDAFSPSGSWPQGFETSGVFSAGATFAYHSFLGPVNFDVSYVNEIDKIRVFFSVGLLLNRSN